MPGDVFLFLVLCVSSCQLTLNVTEDVQARRGKSLMGKKVKRIRLLLKLPDGLLRPTCHSLKRRFPSVVGHYRGADT